ncbi:MAG: right-handed parallel beta-helix repeat-containing protein, partial [Planctomycetes bacterium]|nr:right-handed parallel beta-helix repeat-containing protein [Planctomycetota bacterium]
MHWRNRLIADVSIQDDNHFGTTVNVGLVVYLFAPLQPPPPVPPYPPVYAFRRGGEPFRPRHVWRRLGERVQRQRYIVVTTHETLAEDPATGSPLLFLHAAPGAGGDGTIQSPYGSLTDALADPRASSAIVYTPFGGTFTENIALVDGAIVLSNGPVQQVQTQLGAQVLPYSGTSPDLSNLPQIVGNVAMANDTRFSGFAVTGAVSGAGLSNVTLDKSQVNNNLGTALSLTDLSGQLTLTDLTLTGGPGAGHKGIELSSTAAGLVANLSNITVTDAGSTGIDIDGTAGPFTVTAFRNLSVQKAANGGVLLRSVTFDADPATAGSQQVDGGTMTVGNADSSTDVKGDGLNLTSPSGDLSFAVLDIFNDAGTGLLVDTKTDGTTFSLTTGADSTINTTNGTALNVDPVTTDLRFDSITASGGTNGIVLDQVDPIPGSTVAFTAGSITISNTTGDGLRIVNSSGTYSFDNLSITGAGGHAVAASNVDQLTLTGGNVSITNPAQDAINVVDSNLTIEGITISDAIDVTSRDQDRTVSIQAVTIGAASDSGIVVTGEGTGRLNLTVVDSTITATRFGFNLTNLGTGGIDLTFDRNQTTSLTADAFRAVNRSATGELIIGMNDNTFAATNGRGIVIDPGGANLGLAFTGSTYDDATSIPPDTMGGVGPSHIVELLNGRFAVYNKLTGDRLLAKTLDEFWIDAGQTPQDSAFDPRILYDPATGRWFAASVDDSDVPNNFLLAVSDGSDPTAGWTAFKIDSDSDDLHWADFDALGIDGNAVYLAANMPPIQFAPPGTASEISVLSIPKADLIAPVPTVANATLNEHLSGQGIGFAVQPVVDLGPADGPEPLLAVADGVGTFTVLKRTNVENASTPAATVSVTTDITVAEYSEPPEADQPGTAQNLDAGDSRFSGNVVEVGDSLWAVHSVQDPATGNVAIRWYEIDEATNTVKQSGTISHPDLDYFCPSIAVNASGDVVIGFSASSNNQAASAYAVVGETSAGATRFSTPIELQAGQGEYQRLDADRVNRWGDYSATVVDPSDPNKFWTFQEFVSEQNKWAIRIAEIQPDGSGGGGPTTIRSFSDNVVTTSGAGGIVLNGVSFDADPNLPGNQAVRAGRTSVGSQTAPARGDGVVISNATGTVQFTDLDVFTQNGTALAVFDSDDIRIDTPGTASSFLGTTNAPAVQIVNSTVDMKIHTVDVENAATAIDLNTVSGSFAVTGDGATPGSGGLIRHIGRADRNASAVQISDSDAAVSLNLLQITSMGDDADRAVLLTNDTTPLDV